MARRESQGLQIALIIFVVITVGLAVWVYLLYSQNNDHVANVKKKTDEAAAANTERDKAKADSAELRKQLGYDDTADMARIKGDFAIHMESFEPGFKKEDRNYITLATHLLTKISEANRPVTELQAKVVKLEEDYKQEVAKQQAIAKTTLDAKEAAIVAEQNKVKALEASVIETGDKLKAMQASLAAKDKDVDAKVAAFEGQLKTKDDKIKNDAKTIVGLQRRLEMVENLKPDVTAKPSGRVTFVSPSKTVLIDLGSEDFLMPQTAFQVYAADVINVSEAKPKGRIEVVKIRAGHQAEARIVQDELSNPISANDQIYTKLWEPGKRLRFALVGKIDINGDGRSDLNLVKNLIINSGGSVVAEQGDDGVVQGALDNDTSYLVVGEAPDDKTDEEIRKQFTLMVDKAQQFNIKKMPLEQLIGFLGVDTRNAPTAVGVRRPVTSTTTGTSPAGAAAKPGEEQKFAPRRPPTRGRIGAF